MLTAKAALAAAPANQSATIKPTCSTAFMKARLVVACGPYVCAGCCSQWRVQQVFGSRSYVSGLFLGSRAVALMGLRTRRGLNSGKVDDDPKGRQTLGAYSLRSMLLFPRELRGGSARVRPRPGPDLLGRRTGCHGAGRSMRSGQVCWPAQWPPCCGAFVRPHRPARCRS